MGESKASIAQLYFLSTQTAKFVNCLDSTDSLNISIQPDESRSIIARRCNGAVIGFLETDHALAKLSGDTRKLIEAIIEELYRRKYVSDFLTYLRQPIDFTCEEPVYFKSTATLLANALSMEMVAIREYVELRKDVETQEQEYELRCKAFYHSPQKVICANKDFDAIPPPFFEVITKVRATLATGEPLDWMPAPEYVNREVRHDFLRNDELLRNVKSYVIFPIVVGRELFGLVSCATTAPFYYSGVEIETIRTAIQIIGVAINNYKEFHEVRRLNDTNIRDMAAMTALEVTQATRHALRNIQHEESNLVLNLGFEIEENDMAAIKNTHAQLEVNCLKLHQSVERFKFADPTAKNPEKSSIKAIWESAVADVKPALDEEKIAYRYDGPEVPGMFFKDSLQVAFVNLLLNSRDQFKRRRKHGRSVILTVKRDSLSPNSDRIILDYSDNAGGLDIGAIRQRLNELPESRRNQLANFPLREVVFQEQFTTKSKKGGGGYGLVLARGAARLHDGSLSIEQEGEPGCTFRMVFAKSKINIDKAKKEN